MNKPTVLIPVFTALLGMLIGIALAGWEVLPAREMAARASCADCHDLHGAIEWAEAPFQSQIWLLGDVPQPTYFLVNELLPYRHQERDTALPLLDFLADNGVTDFEQVALESLDGGLVVIDRRFVSEHSLLVPYLEGLRFKDENQHESTWLKGVRWIIVVGKDTPLTIDGQATSMGRLLLGGRTTTVTERGNVAMYKSELDGQIYEGLYTHRYTGVLLTDLLSNPDFTVLVVTDARGRVTEFDAESARGAILAQVSGRTTLVLPELARGQWVTDVVSIEAR
ncbi:MAG: hypothetical protein H5T62_01320 [Anaerolineae bacterium]|nr:hypothetical protein [Anaerolineae bacterium]